MCVSKRRGPTFLMAVTGSTPARMGVAEVDAAADAGVHGLDGVEDVEGRGPLLIFGAVVVDGELDVVLLYELLHAWQDLSGGGSDDDGTPAALT